MVKRNTDDLKEALMEEKQKKQSNKSVDLLYGRGLDIGTGNFAVASYDENDELNTTILRDAFCSIEYDKHKLKMLRDRGVEPLIKDDLMYIFGDKAVEYANIFGNKYPLRRPLAKGVLNPDEKDAQFIIREMLKSLLGKPRIENEVVYFSVPAEPLDAQFNQIFHENKFIALINSLGFDAKPINEAKCIVYNELSEEEYSGMAISFGAGMANIALSFEGDSGGLEFSLTKPGKDPTKDLSYGCGDWIDKNAAVAIGKESHEILDLKEEKDKNGIYLLDLINPTTEVHQAIQIYYKNLIKYLLANLKHTIDNLSNIPRFSKPISIVLSGGTSKARGFDKLFIAEINKYKFPFEIGEVRFASDQLRSVALGALISAMMEYEEE